MARRDAAPRADSVTRPAPDVPFWLLPTLSGLLLFSGVCALVWTKASYCSTAVIRASAAGCWEAGNEMPLSAVTNFWSAFTWASICSGRTL